MTVKTSKKKGRPFRICQRWNCRMATERSAVLLLCSFVLVSVAVVSWKETQVTVLVSNAQLEQEQTKLEAIENQMMGDTPQNALVASQKAAKLQALIASQKAILQSQQAQLKPARVQQLSFQPSSYTAAKQASVWHRKLNPLQMAAEKPMGLDVTEQAKMSAAAQAAQLAKNLALAQTTHAAAPKHRVPSKQARDLAKHLNDLKKVAQQIKPIAHPKPAAGKPVNSKQYRAHTNSPWDTTFPSAPQARRTAARAVQTAAAAVPKPPPGYVTVKTLLPGQKLPPGAVELPSSFMNKLATKGNFVAGAA